MNELRAKIRRECLRWYAENHPETRLEDIGFALGFKHQATASSYLTRIGVKRTRGSGAPSYHRANMHDHTELLRLIKANPDMGHAELSRCIGVPRSVISHLAIRNGIRIGRRKGPRPAWQRVKDAKVLRWFKRHPDASIASGLAAFGYKAHGGATWLRFRQLRLDAQQDQY